MYKLAKTSLWAQVPASSTEICFAQKLEPGLHCRELQRIAALFLCSYDRAVAGNPPLPGRQQGFGARACIHQAGSENKNCLANKSSSLWYTCRYYRKGVRTDQSREFAFHRLQFSRKCLYNELLLRLHFLSNFIQSQLVCSLWAAVPGHEVRFWSRAGHLHCPPSLRSQGIFTKAHPSWSVPSSKDASGMLATLVLWKERDPSIPATRAGTAHSPPLPWP